MHSNLEYTLSMLVVAPRNVDTRLTVVGFGMKSGAAMIMLLVVLV